MHTSFLETLHCPYCGGGFEVENLSVGAGGGIDRCVLECHCHEFPVVAGIAVLRPGVGARIVAAIRHGDAGAAFECAAYDLVPRDVRGRRRRLIDFMTEARAPLGRTLEARDRRGNGLAAREALGGSFAEAVHRLRPESYAHYLEHRFANPSLLGAMAALAILDGMLASAPETASAEGGSRRVLDLACGTGHSSHLIERLHPGSVVCADHDFLNLLLLRRYFVPGVPALCLDLEAPLPFADDAFDVVVCVDALHYVVGKRLLAREMDRVTHPSGGWLLPHVHNARGANTVAGLPLDADGYRRCLGRRDVRILDERYLLDCLHAGEAIDPSAPRPAAVLEGSDALCVVGSGSPEAWRPHGDVLPRLAGNGAGVIVNPIYRQSTTSSEMALELHWPDHRLRAECADIERYLPARAVIDRSLYARLRDGDVEPGDRAAVVELMREFVLVPAPRGYAASPGSR